MLKVLFLCLTMVLPDNIMIFSDSTWCKPCKKMRDEVFSDKEVKEELKKFTLRDNITQKVYDGWNVDTIPTIIIYKDVEGIGPVEIKRHSGFMDKKKFLEFLREKKD